jgi:glutaredoxin-related protein
MAVRVYQIEPPIVRKLPAVFDDGEPILADDRVDSTRPWWANMGDVLPGPLGLVGGMARDVVAGHNETGPVYGVRVELTQFLAHFPELPFELEHPRVGSPGLVRLWYERDRWELSPSAVKRFLAAELRDKRTDFDDGRWIYFGGKFLWWPDAGELLVDDFLKLLYWHKHPRVLEWASTLPG